VIGLDGATLDVAPPWAAAGRAAHRGRIEADREHPAPRSPSPDASLPASGQQESR
jgi:hypothetical protein